MELRSCCLSDLEGWASNGSPDRVVAVVLGHDEQGLLNSSLVSKSPSSRRPWCRSLPCRCPGSPTRSPGRVTVWLTGSGTPPTTRMRERRYPTDMTDAEWAVVRPLLPVPGWMRGRGGQPEAYCHRAMLDAIRYLVDNGIKWRAMPADFPPWDRVYAFFRRWRDHGLVKEFHDRLRGAGPREGGAGRGADGRGDRLAVGQGGRRRRRRQPGLRRRQADQRPQAARRGRHARPAAGRDGHRRGHRRPHRRPGPAARRSPTRTTGWNWSGPTAATPAASSSTAWPRSPWSWRSSNAATTCAASWCCPSGGSSSASSPT